ncbi:MAG: hypothetical protein PHW76_05185 [Alphaproteobacteria bacterium]|nr:hypothetical protein [Alphaproteobacteria bacterium]
MTFFTYFSGLMSIVIIGVGIALMYIDISETIHLDIRRPNILLRALSVILIFAGLLSLGGSFYSALRDWQISKEAARAEISPTGPPAQGVQ